MTDPTGGKRTWGGVFLLRDYRGLERVGSIHEGIDRSHVYRARDDDSSILSRRSRLEEDRVWPHFLISKRLQRLYKVILSPTIGRCVRLAGALSASGSDPRVAPFSFLAGLLDFKQL